MTLIKDLRGTLSALRSGVITDLGLREHAVTIRVLDAPTRTVANLDGTRASVSAVEITPRPRVRAMSAHRSQANGYTTQDAPLTIDRIDRPHGAGDADGYTESDLRPTVTAGQELVYDIGGKAYTVTGVREVRSFGWAVDLVRADQYDADLAAL